jgi:hypothetical protein
MRRATVAVMACAMLAGAASAAKIPLAPADDKPEAPIGAKARARHGPERLAVPAADIGSAEDPARVQDPAVIGGTPQPVPPSKDKPHGWGASRVDQ